jgi:hypothetical protein
LEKLSLLLYSCLYSPKDPHLSLLPSCTPRHISLGRIFRNRAIFQQVVFA